MKIKGRLIATLAALGLLIAMLPIGPASAAVGTVVLTGGEAGKFFSDKLGENVVTIEVTDEDITPARPGIARTLFEGDTTTGARVFSLSTMTLGGEKTKVDRFDGGNETVITNTTDNTDGGAVTSTTVKVDPPKGDAVEVQSVTINADDAADDPGTTTESVWYFDLSQVVRDQHSNSQGSKAGVIDKDDVKVEVDGNLQVETTDYTFSAVENEDLDCDGDPVVCDGGGFNRITLIDDPNDGFQNVVITYEYSEYEFNNDTPIRLAGTRFFHGQGDNYTDANTQVNIDTAGPGSITPTSGIDGTGDPEYVVVNFAYHVKDSKKELVTFSSATAGERRLNMTETSAASNVFQTKVALFSQTDYQAITTEAGNEVNDGDDDDKITILEMKNAFDRTVTTGSGDDEVTTRVYDEGLEVRVQAVLTELNIADTAAASTLVDRLIQVAHGDTMTIVYADSSPAGSILKTAEVDLEAPEVTLIVPVDGLYSNSTAHQLNVDVVDDGAGVEKDDIGLVAAGMSLGSDTAKAPIVDGFRITNVPSNITEGTKTWFVTVIDKVGNTPSRNIDGTSLNEAPKGAAPSGAATADNPYKFTVDTSSPVISGGKTGLSLKNAGVTTGDDELQEVQVSNNKEWVRIQFNLGVGGAPLDGSTITPGDFRVDGAEPLAALVNSKATPDDIVKGGAVYLQVPEQETNAKPKVELVGEIKDLAGNIRSESTISAVNDGLSPTIEVAVDAEIAEEQVTVTVSSSERLGINPVVRTTTTKPVKGVDPAELPGSVKVLAVALQQGSFTDYTATFPKGAGASLQYVVVEATDQSTNKEVVGDASATTDLISFQVDDRRPRVKFEDATGEVLKDVKQEEGAVWLVAQFDEYEHAGDDYWKVSVSDMTLRVKNGDVVTSDLDMLFGQGVEVKCVDQAQTASTGLTDKCVNITLAVTLAPATYTWSITGVDTVGNEVSESVEFTVIAAKPFKLQLKPGVNLVSIPGMPRDDGGMLDVMLADAPVSSVLTYDSMAAASGGNAWLSSVKDPETGVFSGDITMIEPGRAYFITSAASYTVNVKVEPVGTSLPPTISVRQGYNAIGFVTISADATETDIELYLTSIGWSVAYTYDPTPGVGWKAIRKGQSTEDNPIMVKEGQGLLVYAQYDATLTP